MFTPYLIRWELSPDGPAIHTHSSDLLPVQYQGQPAMLKVPRSDEERHGGAPMAWWDGDGAAHTYQRDTSTGVLLLERAQGPRDLTRLVHAGSDDHASQILCAVAARLHTPRRTPPPPLVSLDRWFQALTTACPPGGDILHHAASSAQALLATPREVTVLHGDLHHQNILDGEARGWLAIDPKGLLGERCFDFANIFYNPDLDLARQPGRLEHQVDVVSRAANLDPVRLLRWIVAYGGLSATWWIQEGREEDARPVLDVVRIAHAALGRQAD
ncbi:3'-kinase [Deinococcus irradiatisoli]|uniref:3'-kinase n=1 Tax=Deinococcus irradiatisoli TaxID=2202254 RepID=A0A2Z3JJU3_9DEIO|nr:aminoglycoside phosphotransferase family protein [Deinococcus irradiatisoli]AWN22198.1 3'-kinase [Deinococcus irradiatisoli]